MSSYSALSSSAYSGLHFKFTDGLYYYEYNKSDNLEYGMGGRKDRGRNEIKDYCYIPIKYLVKLE